MNRLFLSCVVGAGLAFAQTPATPKTATPAKPAVTTPKPAAPAAAKPAAPKPVVPAKPKPVVPPAPPEPDRDPGLYADFDIWQGTDNFGHIIVKFYETEMPITVHNFVD